MRKRFKLLLALGLVVALAAAGFAASTRMAGVAQAAPVCAASSKPSTTPPAQLVSAADYFGPELAGC